jgi:hypothetical protein
MGGADGPNNQVNYPLNAKQCQDPKQARVHAKHVSGAAPTPPLNRAWEPGPLLTDSIYVHTRARVYLELEPLFIDH